MRVSLLQARRIALGAALLPLALGIVPTASHAQDTLPPLPAETGEGPEAARAPQLPKDPPLSALTVDIRARNAQGQLVPEVDLPIGCWAASGLERPPVFFDGGPGSGVWNCRDLLQPARFCHQPLYFDDAALERCGELTCCGPLHAVTHFACDLALLPMRLLVQHPCSCVCTPTPHCCSPYGCGACGH